MSSVKEIERTFRRGGGVVTALPWESAATAAKAIKANRVGCVVVVDGEGKAVGILSERDIVNRVVAASLDPEQTTVSDVMTRNMISCRTATEIGEAHRLMASHVIRHLPIIENGIPVGMISLRDVLNHQLSMTRAILSEQSRMLHDIEEEYPGITQLQKTKGGRIVI